MIADDIIFYCDIPSRQYRSPAGRDDFFLSSGRPPSIYNRQVSRSRPQRDVMFVESDESRCIRVPIVDSLWRGSRWNQRTAT